MLKFHLHEVNDPNARRHPPVEIRAKSLSGAKRSASHQQISQGTCLVLVDKVGVVAIKKLGKWTTFRS